MKVNWRWKKKNNVLIKFSLWDMIVCYFFLSIYWVTNIYILGNPKSPKLNLSFSSMEHLPPNPTFLYYLSTSDNFSCHNSLVKHIPLNQSNSISLCPFLRSNTPYHLVHLTTASVDSVSTSGVIFYFNLAFLLPCLLKTCVPCPSSL